MKTDIIYTDNTLFVNLSGIMTKEDISQLKRKVYKIVSEYSINNVVIDIRKILTMDKEKFYCFLDEYNNNFISSLKLMEN